MDFCTTRNGVSQNMQQDRYYSEIIAVDPNIISVTPDDQEEAKDDGSEPLFFVQSIFQLKENIFVGKNISMPE
jgi:hypothetical protein